MKHWLHGSRKKEQREKSEEDWMFRRPEASEAETSLEKPEGSRKWKKGLWIGAAVTAMALLLGAAVWFLRPGATVQSWETPVLYVQQEELKGFLPGQEQNPVVLKEQVYGDGILALFAPGSPSALWWDSRDQTLQSVQLGEEEPVTLSGSSWGQYLTSDGKTAFYFSRKVQEEDDTSTFQLFRKDLTSEQEPELLFEEVNPSSMLAMNREKSLLAAAGFKEIRVMKLSGKTVASIEMPQPTLVQLTDTCVYAIDYNRNLCRVELDSGKSTVLAEGVTSAHLNDLGQGYFLAKSSREIPMQELIADDREEAEFSGATKEIVELILKLSKTMSLTVYDSTLFYLDGENGTYTEVGRISLSSSYVPYYGIERSGETPPSVLFWDASQSLKPIPLSKVAAQMEAESSVETEPEHSLEIAVQELLFQQEKESQSYLAVKANRFEVENSAIFGNLHGNCLYYLSNAHLYKVRFSEKGLSPAETLGENVKNYQVLKDGRVLFEQDHEDLTFTGSLWLDDTLLGKGVDYSTVSVTQDGGIFFLNGKGELYMAEENGSRLLSNHVKSFRALSREYAVFIKNEDSLTGEGDLIAWRSGSGLVPVDTGVSSIPVSRQSAIVWE